MNLLRISTSMLLVLVPAYGQIFNSGSTGADGALTYTTPGPQIFDPKAFNPVKDADGDTIFNFTTITIGAGVTLRMAGNVYAPPVIWLAQGAVKIDGILDLSGQDGFSASNTTQRLLTVPGSGGYGGGYPGVGANPPGDGLGPFFGVANGCANGGFSGNQFDVPLVGGSGGGGYNSFAGGAGGGAILIASSLSISGAGSIKATGGSAVGSSSGAGAGGAIRLVAPSVTIAGKLDAAAGPQACGNGHQPFSGVVRIEAFQIGAITAGGSLYTATPFGLFLPTLVGIPTVRVTSVGGIAVVTNPTGTFAFPDVNVNSNAALPFVIQASNVPLGTTVTLKLFSENGADKVLISTGLTGTLASSTVTISTTIPPGFSTGFVTATWTP